MIQPDGTPRQEVLLSELLEQFIPGDDPDSSWSEFMDALNSSDGSHIDWLATSIQETGIHHPIYLSINDLFTGRPTVRDGHHRLTAASILGLTYVPVTFGGIYT